MDKIKSIIVYDSWTKNTKKVADEIAKELKCKAISIDNIDTYRFDNYDLIIIGTPVHGFRPTKKIQKFLKNIKKPKYCILFCTYGAPLWGKKSAEKCLNYMEKKFNIKCLGKFECRGFHHILRTYKNHPDKNDLLNVKMFIREILRKF